MPQHYTVCVQLTFGEKSLYTNEHKTFRFNDFIKIPCIGCKRKLDF